MLWDVCSVRAPKLSTGKSGSLNPQGSLSICPLCSLPTSAWVDHVTLEKEAAALSLLRILLGLAQCLALSKRHLVNVG